MATNPYFGQSVRSEQGLYEDIIIESLKIYGQDIYYLPRDILNEDKLLGEDIPSRFNSSYKIEMYVENMDGFDGEGDLFTKFGVEIRDQATMIVSRRRWLQTIHRHDNEITLARPAEGDLLYIPFSKKLFQISHVEHESPFYQLQNLPTFKLRVELFDYNEEDFDTNIEAIDSIQEDYGYAYNLTLNTTKTTATASATIDSGGSLSAITLINAGLGYASAPTITIGQGDATATATIDGSGVVTFVNITDSAGGYVSTPTITFSAPAASNVGFTVGGMADQTLADGTILSAEVVSYNDSDNILKLVQLGASDGNFHLPVVGRMFIDRTLSAGSIVASVTEEIQASANEQNEYFDTLTDFLDFSESNPFGEP